MLAMRFLDIDGTYDVLACGPFVRDGGQLRAAVLRAHRRPSGAVKEFVVHTLIEVDGKVSFDNGHYIPVDGDADDALRRAMESWCYRSLTLFEFGHSLVVAGSMVLEGGEKVEGGIRVAAASYRRLQRAVYRGNGGVMVGLDVRESVETV